MKIRMLVVPVILLVALAGCTPSPATPAGPGVSPSATSAGPSTTPTVAPTADPVALPANCDALVSTVTVQREFSPKFDSKPFTVYPGDVRGQNFTDRGGLICIWAIPQSEAFVAIYVAERATASDADQVAAWAASGFTNCSPYLDACFSHDYETEVGGISELYALAGGYELQIRTSAGSLDGLRVLAQEASTNMGYV